MIAVARAQNYGAAGLPGVVKMVVTGNGCCLVAARALPTQVRTHVIADAVAYFKAPGAPVGTVPNIAMGTGLTGEPIAKTATISLAQGSLHVKYAAFFSSLRGARPARQMQGKRQNWLRRAF